MDDIWRDALLYNKWANLQLLDSCARLSEQQLQLASPGTYGSIADTWLHLLAAEQRYIFSPTWSRAERGVTQFQDAEPM